MTAELYLKQNNYLRVFIQKEMKKKFKILNRQEHSFQILSN